MRNYRAYRGVVELELPESGVWRVAGASGVGKSALLSAVPYLLGYGKSPTSRSVSWGEKTVEVKGTFQNGNSSFTVSRGSSGFKLQYSGQTWSAKAAEDKLREILAVPTDLMECLTRRRQGVAGTFVSMENADRADLLVQLLGVVEYDDRIAKVTSQIQEVERWVVTRGDKVRELERRLATYPQVDFENEIGSRLAAAVDAEASAKEAVERCARDLAAAEAEAASHNTEVDAMLRRATEIRQDLQLAERRQQERVLAARFEIHKELEARRVERARVAVGVAQRVNLVEELRALRLGQCVTCGSPRANIQRVSSEIQTKIDALPGREHLDALDAEIAIGTEVLNKFQLETDPVIVALQERILSLASSRRQVSETVRNQLLTAERTVGAAKAEVQRLKLEYDYEFRRSTERLGVQSELDEARGPLREAETQLAELEDLRHLLRTWISAYFEEVLADLSERTSQVLTTVPNVEEWRVDFRSEIQTKRGTSRRGVFVVPQHRGEDRSLDGEDLSGGMKSAIYLAVDLALAALVAERTGAALGWLLVDEAFDGLDQPSRERCLEMVQAFAQERGVLVLLVTHSCEVQEALSGIISVEVGPEGSRVQVMES